MLKRLAFVALAVSLAGGLARAQETEESEESTRPEPVRRIKVLQHPYDIASFYRSRQGEYFAFDEGAAGSRYPIAGFYRSRQSVPYGYAPFWNQGYGYRRGGVTVGYRRRIGENGDLFLLAPTFLAPVGPLNGAFGY
ncbi:MAG TPA: hypothetical protein VLI67_02600 [Vicinamibacteria bacterium]|nr:hypothetical protein [Vicinamibacteria bacterium]